MPLKSISRKYNLTQGELLQLAIEKSTFFKRDQATLAQRGITADNLDALETLIHAFRATKEDTIYRGLIHEAIEKRNAKRKQLELLGRDIIGIAATVFAKKSSILKSFGFAKASNLSDGKLMIAASTLLSKATEHSTTMIPRGLTLAMLAEFNQLIDELEPLVKNLAAIKSERDINTQNRLTVANNLYAELKHLCLIAANYYKDRDSARYPDYLIYKGRDF
jgi:hypothetical protein